MSSFLYGMIPLKKPNLQRCFNFLVTATYDKYASFLKNFAPCITGRNQPTYSTSQSLLNNLYSFKKQFQARKECDLRNVLDYVDFWSFGLSQKALKTQKNIFLTGFTELTGLFCFHHFPDESDEE